MVLPGTAYYKRLVGEGLLGEQAYKQALRQGYFFHNMPDALNFSSIPSKELREFREGHPIV